MADTQTANSIVYVLMFNNFYGDDGFIGVYSTREKAQARIDKHAPQDRAQFRIDETVIDEDEDGNPSVRF